MITFLKIVTWLGVAVVGWIVLAVIDELMDRGDK